MKYLHLFIIALFLPKILTQSESNDAELLEQLKKKVFAIQPPYAYSPYLRNIMGVTDIVEDSFDKRNPDIIREKYKFIPEKIIEKFKTIKFLRETDEDDFKFILEKEKGARVIYCIGVVRKIDDQKLVFAYIQSDQHGTLLQKENHGSSPTPYTDDEINEMSKKLESHCIAEMKRKLLNVDSTAEVILTSSFDISDFGNMYSAKFRKSGELLVGRKYIPKNGFGRWFKIGTRFTKEHLIGSYQDSKKGPFTLEVSTSKKEIAANEKQNLFLMEDEENQSNDSNELVETTTMKFLDKDRRVYYSVDVRTGNKPYRLTMTEMCFLLLSDYDWTPLWESTGPYQVYASFYDVIIPQGYKYYSENNQYFLFLFRNIRKGHLGVFKESGNNVTEIWSVEDNKVPGPYMLVIKKTSGNLAIVDNNYKSCWEWESQKTTHYTRNLKLIVSNEGKLQVWDSKANEIYYEI